MARLPREGAFKIENVTLRDVTNYLENVRGDALEIRVEFAAGTAKRHGLRVRFSEDGSRGLEIAVDANGFDVAGTKGKWAIEDRKTGATLRVFLDRTVLEVYAGDRNCATRVIAPGEKDLGLGIFAADGEVKVRSLEVWPLRSIW